MLYQSVGNTGIQTDYTILYFRLGFISFIVDVEYFDS